MKLLAVHTVPVWREENGSPAQGSECPTCGTDDPSELFAQIDRGRAYDAGISGCPDPFHDDAHTQPPGSDDEQGCPFCSYAGPNPILRPQR